MKKFNIDTFKDVMIYSPSSYRIQFDKDYFEKGDILFAGEEVARVRVVKVFKERWYKKLLRMVGIYLPVYQVRVEKV
jgi:hypothetical protein